MSMKNRIKEIAQTFAWVTTGIVLANAIFITIVYHREVEVSSISFLAIPGVALLTSLCNLIYPNHEVSKKAMIIYKTIHYFLINAIVLACGSFIGWFSFKSPGMVITMEVIITAIFFGTHWVMSWKDAKLADKINEKLKNIEEE